jgi:hypothetical protein
MRERILVYLLIFLISFTSGAICIAEENKKPEISSDKSAQTTSEAATKKRDLQPFNNVNLSGVGNLHIKQSNQENFTIDAPEDVLPLIIVYVKDKTLYIDLKDASKHADAKINYYLNVKKIQNIVSYTSSSLFIKEGLETDTLNLTIGNLGEADVLLNVKKLTAKIDGGGKITAAGSAIEQNIEINGAGEINFNKLVGKIGTIDIKGSGAVITQITDKLAATIAGDGVVQYCGQPDISRQITGAGKVEALGEKGCR